MEDKFIVFQRINLIIILAGSGGVSKLQRKSINSIFYVKQIR